MYTIQEKMLSSTLYPSFLLINATMALGVNQSQWWDNFQFVPSRPIPLVGSTFSDKNIGMANRFTECDQKETASTTTTTSVGAIALTPKPSGKRLVPISLETSEMISFL